MPMNSSESKTPSQLGVGPFLIKIFLAASKDSTRGDFLPLVESVRKSMEISREVGIMCARLLEGRSLNLSTLTRWELHFSKEIKRQLIEDDSSVAQFNMEELVQVFEFLRTRTVFNPYKNIFLLPKEIGKEIFLTCLENIPKEINTGQMFTELGAFEWATEQAEYLINSPAFLRQPQPTRQLLSVLLGVSGLQFERPSSENPVFEELTLLLDEEDDEEVDQPELQGNNFSDFEEVLEKSLEPIVTGNKKPVILTTAGSNPEEPDKKYSDSISTSIENPPKKVDKEEVPKEVRVRIKGTAKGRPRAGILCVVAGLSGWALISGLLRILATVLIGYRRIGEIVFDGHKLIFERQSRLFGRTVRKSRDVIRPGAVSMLGKEVKYPQGLIYAGLFFLVLGVITGVITLLDGVQGEYIELSLLGFGILLTGIILDFGLTSLSGCLPGRTSLRLIIGKKEFHRLTGVREAGVDRLIEAVSPHLTP